MTVSEVVDAITRYSTPVDRSLVLPAWAQVVRDLRNLIGRIMVKGEKLPAESELAEIYGVSRVTIRQALAELEGGGIVERRQGIGTFVLETSQIVEHDLRVSTHWRSRFEKHAHDAQSSELSRVKERPLPLDLVRLIDPADSLGEFVCITRRHSVDGIPIGLVETWVNLRDVPDIENIPLTDGSLSRTIVETIGMPLDLGDRVMYIEQLNSHMAELLEVNIGDCAFAVLEVFRSNDKNCVLSKTLWRGDAVRFRY